jgi:hypothetical protein
MADSDDDIEPSPHAPDATDAPEPEAETDPPAPDEGEDAAPAAAPKRRSLGPTMLLLGAGLWVVAGALRCSGPAGPTGPTAAVTVEPGEEPEAIDPAGEVSPTPEPGIADAPPAMPMADATPSDAPAGGIPEEEEDLEPPTPADWASRPQPPEQVKYRIRRGGTAKTVANLYKIFHHEMTELNPGVDLDRELPPGTDLLVYRRSPTAVSESVGIPSAGSVVGGVPMMDGAGRELKAIPWKSYGTAHTVATLDKILDQWAARGHSQPVLVGNMSAREGGRLEPHSTHQSGRDVDLSYIQRLPKGEELNWREMTRDNLDAAETWKLLQLLRESGAVEMVFIDREVQKLLYDWAVSKGGMSKRKLEGWMEYPRNGPIPSAFIQHVPGHVDHIHARFSCPPDQTKCRSRER